MPEELIIPTKPSQAKDSDAQPPLKRSERLTLKMRACGTEKFLHLRRHFYGEAGSAADLLPSYIFFPEPVIKAILDNFARIKKLDDLQALVNGHTYMEPNLARVWEAIQQLRTTFDAMPEEQKAANRLRPSAARAARRARLAALKDVVDNEDGVIDNEEDESVSDAENELEGSGSDSESMEDSDSSEELSDSARSDDVSEPGIQGTDIAPKIIQTDRLSSVPCMVSSGD